MHVYAFFVSENQCPLQFRYDAEKFADIFEPSAVEPGVLNFLDDCAETEVWSFDISECKLRFAKLAQILQVVKIVIVQCSISMYV